MSETLVRQIVCDMCGATEYMKQDSHGIPTGWIFGGGDFGRTSGCHACARCQVTFKTVCRQLAATTSTGDSAKAIGSLIRTVATHGKGEEQS